MGADADLVLEGGGVKGIGLVGAYSVLQQSGYTFHRVAGTSAGAIVGALIAAEMPADKLRTLMQEIDYKRFQDESFIDHLGAPGKIASLLFEKGIYEGTYLHDWLEGVLAPLGTRTFGDLKIDDPGSSLPPERSYRLVVMASDVSRGELVRFPWDYEKYGLSADDQLVADAVRASMSIPFFFEPARLKGTDEQGHGVQSILVDGGMLSNFPIDVFDRTDGKPPRWPTFGVKLSARAANMQIEKFQVHNTFELTRALIGTMTNFHDQMHIDEPSVVDRTIFVDTLGVKATDFSIERPTQDQLFKNGTDAASKFLSTWNFDAYVKQFR
jgi:NTE family protein